MAHLLPSSARRKSSEQYCSIFAIHDPAFSELKIGRPKSIKTAEAGSICLSEEASMAWKPTVRHQMMPIPRANCPRKHCASLMPVPETHGKRSPYISAKPKI
jgi:hypothetical protein